MTTTTTIENGYTEINGYKVPNSYIVKAAEYLYQVIRNIDIPDICEKCSGFIEVPSSWNGPGWCDCEAMGEFFPHLEECWRHKKIFEHEEILEIALEDFRDDNDLYSEDD